MNGVRECRRTWVRAAGEVLFSELGTQEEIWVEKMSSVWGIQSVFLLR